MDSPTPSLISLAGPVNLDTYSIPPTPPPPMGYLLSLPYELRSQIWEEYFGYWRILELRLYCRRRRLADDPVGTSGAGPSQSAGSKTPCPDPAVSQDNELIYIGSLKQKPPTCYNRFDDFASPEPPRQWLSLLCLNRQVHQEVKRVLFHRRVWMIEDGELPFGHDCEREHAFSTCTLQKYHSVHLTLQSHLPPSGNDTYGFYSTIFLSLANLRFLWNLYVEIELVGGRDMHLIDWICKTLSHTLSPSFIHAHNNTTIAMRYVGQDLANEHRRECWTARHRREFMDAAWMRFHQPGLVIAGASYAGQRERPAGWCYTTLKERAPFTLVSSVKNECEDGINASITRISMRGGPTSPPRLL